MKQIFTTAALAIALAACSSREPDSSGNAQTMPATDDVAPAAAPLPEPQPRVASPAAAPPAANLLTLEGLGALRIGEPVPAGTGWAERGAQISDECRIVSSPDFPGVYAIVEQGRVRRISLGERSDVTLAGGLGVGAGEAEVRAAFPGLREEGHAYVEPPAKYLTSPDASSAKAGLRFEIDADRKVSIIHAGTMPVLGYVEGCA